MSVKLTPKKYQRKATWECKIIEPCGKMKHRKGNAWGCQIVGHKQDQIGKGANMDGDGAFATHMLTTCNLAMT